MKLDFDIVSRGGALDFEIKNTKTINASGGIGEDVVREIIAEETANLQPKRDEALKTQNKEIVGAINELHEREDKQGLSEEQVKAVVRATAVTQETDPTVPDWAKQAEKPTYSYNEITGKPNLFSGNYNDLSNKPTIPSTEGLATVEQLENLTNKTDELEEYSIREVSLNLVEDNELSVELKDKEGNVIASAETTLPMPDLSAYVKNTDYATSNKPGLVRGNPSGGVRIEEYVQGLAYIERATDDEIDHKSHRYKPIVPINLDYAIKSGITGRKADYSTGEKIFTYGNQIPLTDEEKASACDWLGAMLSPQLESYNIAYVLCVSKNSEGKNEYRLESLDGFLQRSNTGVDTGKIPMYTGNIIDKSEEYANMNATLYVATPKGKKQAANKEYVDNLVGDIESVLTAILGV